MPFFSRASLIESANRLRPLTESKAVTARTASATNDFDIFLSHSSLDTPLVDAADTVLRGLGFTVYLDRRVDPGLDPSRVDRATVEKLQERLRQSRCLLVATSTNITASNWVPWEMGFMDGMRHRVASLPILATKGDTFKGKEYFEVYPKAEGDTVPPTAITVTLADRRRVNLRDWLAARH